MFDNFCSLSHQGLLLKGRICSLESKFLPLRVAPLQNDFHLPRKTVLFCCSVRVVGHESMAAKEFRGGGYCSIVLLQLRAM